MTWIIVVIVVLLVAAIIFVSEKSSPIQKSRMQFLKELTDFWEGKLQSLPSDPDSFQIHFNFEGRDFIFEDILETGFKDKINRVSLKTVTSTNIDLYFTQKEQKSVQMKTMIVSDIPDEPIKNIEKLNLPPELKELNAHTNNLKLVNGLFEDVKVSAILMQFKNVDLRGYSKMPLKIRQGVIILEFYSEEGISKPHISGLYTNVSSLEQYLQKLKELAKKVERLNTFQ